MEYPQPPAETAATIAYDDFAKVDIRAGTIVAVLDINVGVPIGTPGVLIAPSHGVPDGVRLF